EWFGKMCRSRPGRIALGVDARDGHVATDGWMETRRTSAFELVKQFADYPLAAIIFTDIATDGMLAGPNLGAMAAMKEAASQPVIASGGVTTIDDVKRLAMVPMHGAIVGRALYEGRIHLPDALVAANDDPPASPATSSRDF
ncbi:MAG TPA: HisA/HisF-related TIM barrel protein, partial [Pirellulales bacterium]